MKFRINLLLLISLSTIGMAFGQTDAQKAFDKGKSNYENAQYEQAINNFEEAVELSANNAEYHYWLGIANIGALEEASIFKKATLSYDARSHLMQAIELDPSHQLARVRLANYYIQAPAIAGGSYSKALEQAEALKSYNATAGAELEATVYLEQEEFDQAEKVYLDLLEKGNNNEKVYYRLSVVSIGRKNYQKALAYCKQSISTYPDYLMGYYQYGKVSSLGKIDLAQGIKHLNTYLDSEIPSNLPKKHWAYLRLGNIYELQGQKASAKKAYEEAIKLNRGFKEAKAALEELED